MFCEDLTEKHKLRDLQQYISGCKRTCPYGYGAGSDIAAKFEVLGALNMYKMNDFLVSSKTLLQRFKRMHGIVTPSGLVAPAGTITPVHLEDNSRL